MNTTMPTIGVTSGGGIKSLRADLNNRIHEIHQWSQTWTATEDCILIGTMKMSNNTAAQIYINTGDGDKLLVSSETTTDAYKYIGNEDIGFAIPKDTIVKTRVASGGVYQLNFYAIAE